MRTNTGILILIGLVLLVGVVGAAIPDTVTITSNKNWIVANNLDQSIIYHRSHKHDYRTSCECKCSFLDQQYIGNTEFSTVPQVRQGRLQLPLKPIQKAVQLKLPLWLPILA